MAEGEAERCDFGSSVDEMQATMGSRETHSAMAAINAAHHISTLFEVLIQLSPGLKPWRPSQAASAITTARRCP
jgi:hypothetical protein